MYTICPQCRKKFRVQAAQLTAAGGEVRCGLCRHRFNALAQLHDDPSPAYETPEYQEALAEILEQESEERGRPFWLVGALLLASLLALQTGWHYRNELLTRYPILLPWAQRFCDWSGCLALRQGALQPVKVLHRDIRFHPFYEGALLANLAIVNRSSRRIPYPNFQFLLHGEEEQAIAYREFAPREYLGGAQAGLAGMPPMTPVHVVLELAGPAAPVRSFEIGFAYPRNLVFFAR